MDPITLDFNFQALRHGLKQQRLLTVEPLPDGSPIIKPLGLFARFWHWNDASFHKERFTKLAALVTKIIAIQPRLSIEAAAEDPSLKTARALLKVIHQQRLSSPEIDALKREVTAAKLGIESAVFEKNPGLQKFTETYHLERYLLGYHDTLHVEPDTNKAFLRKDGKLQPWEQIYEESKSWPKPVKSPAQPWVYGPDGIQNKDMYDWTELVPFMKGNPADWHYQYVFEFCTCTNPNSIKVGNHSWVRLKTPSGDIYSVGLYRPDKADWTDNLNAPLRIKAGYLMQPDVSGFWDFPISTVDFAIREETFFKIKETIERDKMNEDIVFQLFNNNCLLYCKNLAKLEEENIDIPTLENVLHLVVPPSFADKVSAFMNKLPNFIQKICFVVSSFFLNLALIALGGCLIDKNLNERQRKRAVPHMTSFWDLFNTKKNFLNHPNTMTFKITKKVQEWRQKEIEALHKAEIDLQLRQEKERQIRLSLPPSFYTNRLA